MKRLSMIMMLGWLLGCETDPEEAGPGEESDAGGESKDAGVTLLPRPADRTFSIGLSNASNGAPQSASLVGLLFEVGTPDLATVVAKRVASAPTLDGDASDWASLPESPIALTTPAAAVGLTQEGWTAVYSDAGRPAPKYDHGISEVKVRAAYDDENLYLLLQWKDETEDRQRDRLVYNAGAFTKSGNDDRAYVAFSVANSFPEFESEGCAGACHIRETTPSVKNLPDGGTLQRTRWGMRTREEGQKVDAWLWRAFQTNPTGFADDTVWTDLRRDADGPLGWFESNQRKPADGGVTLEPVFMSAAGVNANPEVLFLPDAGFAGGELVPFDIAGITDGASFPGHVHRRAEPARADVRAVGKWANNTWTVEFTRKLVNDDSNDEQFSLQ